MDLVAAPGSSSPHPLLQSPFEGGFSHPYVCPPPSLPWFSSDQLRIHLASPSGISFRQSSSPPPPPPPSWFSHPLPSLCGLEWSRGSSPRPFLVERDKWTGGALEARGKRRGKGGMS
ncbi:hypothetical protein IE53DRAFT_237519 [Violaceomyces palustris]|uniref:Uncharacterized protein n=1 Tax=Violaceomyces palustris TaxID=1673888 RepID=A0ACD0NPD6_9BASI|nr:hypothetical protein IE53DRAFT_237519 [Violaceomyces palustris]